MKTEKMSLKGIKNVLSRAELKKIMAGSDSGGPGGGGCSPYINQFPAPAFYCCERSGYVLATVYTQCCASTAVTQTLCQGAAPGYDHITGPC